jgi:hypothetical protein
MKNKKESLFKLCLITVGITVGVFAFLIAIAYMTGIFNSQEQEKALTPYQEKINTLTKIIEDYHSIHTYSLTDFFVCSDMAIDVWDLVKTKGINAKICSGNVKENLSLYKTDLEYFNKMDHAWVIAEVEPFKFVALETTGNYLVFEKNTNEENVTKNDLYYNGLCFNTPSEYKRFIELRTDYLKTCQESIDMIDYWNNNYVGKYLTNQISEYKGRLEQKREECVKIDSELKGLLT